MNELLEVGQKVQFTIEGDHKIRKGVVICHYEHTEVVMDNDNGKPYVTVNIRKAQTEEELAVEAMTSIMEEMEALSIEKIHVRTYAEALYKKGYRKNDV